MGVMNLAEIMDKSIEILKKYIKTIIMFSIAYGVIMFVGMVIFMLIGGGAIAASAVITKNIIFTGILVAILVFIVIALTFTANIGIIKIASQEFFEERIYASSAVGASFKSIIKVLGVTIIAFISFLPAAGIFAAPIYFLYRWSKSAARIANMNQGVIVKIIAIIIIIVYVLAALAVILAYITMFIFSLQALVVEGKSVITSVKRSFSLVRQDFWKIYGGIILFGVTTFAIRYSLMSFWALMISLLFMILKFLNVAQSYTTFLTVALTYSNWPISLISWCIISPIGTIMISLLYFNQRFKKEGYDLELRLKEIQKSKERDGLNDSSEFDKSI